MNPKQEFSKWIEAVESAISGEQIIKIPAGLDICSNTCDCGNWDCSVCFPEQDSVKYNDQARSAVVTNGEHANCPSCGQPLKMSPDINKDHSCDLDMFTIGPDEEEELLFNSDDENLPNELPIFLKHQARLR